MSRRTRPIPLGSLAVLAAGTLAAAGLAAPAAAAAHGAAAAPAAAVAATPPAVAGHAVVQGGVETVVLQLTPRDTALLHATAQSSATLPAATRLDRLARAIAGPARAASVAAASRRLGLAVTSSTDYAVTVTGTPAQVLALFGSARDNDPSAPTAQPLPTLPPTLRGLVTVADGGDDTRPAELPHLATSATSATTAAAPDAGGAGSRGTLSVAQIRSLYDVTATTAPPAANAPIVATLQLSSWSTEASDFPGFARDNGIYPTSYDPMKTIATEGVNAGCPTSGGDETEDALDQETLLAIAPQVRQRIYFAGNCISAQDLALDQAATDVRNGAPILAFSTSWGGCEPQTYSGQQQATADQDAVDTAAAAGITVFAASGDAGSYDCSTARVEIGSDAVDSPAVVPGVVGVGGTTLTGDGGLTAWNDTTGASGGGFSCGVYARPAYQDVVAATPTYPHNASYHCPVSSSARQVPDIAADAGDGLDVVDSIQGDGPVYGTSFGAPLAAGGLAQTLARAGRTRGLGIISGLLYQDPGGFHDVTSGSNGDYATTQGYDEVTGLGTPDWQALLATGTSVTDIGTTSGGAVTLRTASGPSWAAVSGTVTTPLVLGDPSQWQLFTAPYAGDGAADLWAVRLAGGASGKVEVHVLSQVSGYQTYLAHIATAQPAVDPTEFQVRAGSFAGDGASDLFLVFTHGTGSGRVEVHVLSAAASFHSFLAHDATALASTTSGWSYLVGDSAGSGDLVAVGYGATGSGHTEVHVLSRASGYRTFTLHRVTPQSLEPTDGSVQWSLRDLTGDGVPEVVLLLLPGGSGHTEVHALTGPAYTGYAVHAATGLPVLPDSDTVGMPE